MVIPNRKELKSSYGKNFSSSTFEFYKMRRNHDALSPKNNHGGVLLRNMKYHSFITIFKHNKHNEK